MNRESFLLPIDTPDAIEVDDKGELRGDAANRAMISMASVLAPLEAPRSASYSSMRAATARLMSASA